MAIIIRDTYYQNNRDITTILEKVKDAILTLFTDLTCALLKEVISKVLVPILDHI